MLEFLLVDGKQLVIGSGDHTGIVREGAVDELGSEHRLSDRKADFSLGELDLDFRLAVHDEAVHFTDGLAGNDDARHVSRARRKRQLKLREAMPVRRHRPQSWSFRHARRVQVYSIEIVPGFLGRDRKAGLIDQPFEVGRS